MITVDFEGNSYLFSRSDKGQGYWSGNGGPKSGRYPGICMVAPSIMWPELRAAAIEQGADAEVMAYKPLGDSAEKKSRTKKVKTTKNTIAIF
jgi:hypothetical protein